MLPYLSAIQQMGFSYYFQFTVTPYGRSMETNLPDKAVIEEAFVSLSQSIGAQRVLWRYDPIVLNDIFDMRYHITQFERLCARFCGYTETVTISFVDLYAKLKNPPVCNISEQAMSDLAAALASIAKKYHIKIAACCENANLAAANVAQAACIDRLLIERLTGRPLHVKPDRNQRAGCGCAASADIGTYNTCGHGCVYCYANRSAKSAQQRTLLHDSQNEYLI